MSKSLNFNFKPNHYLLLIICWLILSSNSLQAQGWIQTYPELIINGDESSFLGLSDIQQTSDGGYISVGTQKELLDNDVVVMLKTDANGNTQWTTLHNQGAHCEIHAIKQTSDGYIYAGAKGSLPFVVKTDNTGTIEWEDLIDNSGVLFGTNGIFYDIGVTEEEYLVCGKTYTGDIAPPAHNEFVIKYNAQGNQIWSTSTSLSGSMNTNTFNEMIALPNGDFIGVGSSTVFDFSATFDNTSAIVARISTDGEEVWTSVLSAEEPSSNLNGKAITLLSDGNIAIVGNYSTNLTIQDSYPRILKLNSADGTIIWDTTYEIPAVATSITPGIDGTIVVATNTNIPGPTIEPFDRPIKLLYLSAYGVLEQTTSYQEGIYDANVNKIITTNDGHLALAGNISFHNFEDNPLNEFYPFPLIMKLESASSPYNNQLSGTIYQDGNGNCVQDASDEGIAGVLVKINPEQRYTLTDADGNYYFGVNDGEVYTIKAYLPENNFWLNTCSYGNEQVIDIDTDDYENVDFGRVIDTYCPLMEVNLGVPFLRRCMDNVYKVYYCNNGTEDAIGAYVEVAFDEVLGVSTSSIPGTLLGDNVYRYDVGDIATGDCGNFSITVIPDCDINLEATACAEAHIYPDETCREPDPNWDESSIEVAAVCEGDSIQFTIRNIGLGDMIGPSGYRIYEDDLLFVNTQFQLLSGGELDFKYPTNGTTVRLEADQCPGHPGFSLPRVSVELCGELPFSLGFITTAEDDDQNLFEDIECEQIIGSFDPNDKQATPTGIAEGNYISDSTLLEYKIRFQNTGNDTAFTVVVVDTISPALDVTTIHPGVSSHDYEFEYLGEQVVRWTFNNILLVDSNANEPESHGFLKFNIQQKANNPIGTIIENNAAIYFDYNPPIITNTVFHTVGIPEFGHPSVLVKAKVFLQEAYAGASLMRTDLRDADLLPLLQPYSRPPWNYHGPERFLRLDLMPADVVDWVLLEVRDANNVDLVLETKAALLLNNGDIVSAVSPSTTGVPFFNITAGESYHLVIRHRNHIDLLGTYSIAFPNSSTYNFSSPIIVEGGIAQLHNLGDGNYSMIAGDFTGDGVMTVTDFNLFLYESSTINAYSPADCNLDGHVTVNDFNYYKANVSKIGVSAIRY